MSYERPTLAERLNEGWGFFVALFGAGMIGLVCGMIVANNNGEPIYPTVPSATAQVYPDATPNAWAQR